MAKLSAHGNEVGRIEFTTSAKAYMSDGRILKNSGFGWKLHAKCKDGVTPQQAFENQKCKTSEFLAQRPAYAAYKACLHSLAGLSKRWKLHAAVQMMPEDADGVWSEACDGYGDNVSADISEVSELCSLYLLAIRESDALKATTATTD